MRKMVLENNFSGHEMKKMALENNFSGHIMENIFYSENGKYITVTDVIKYNTQLHIDNTNQVSVVYYAKYHITSCVIWVLNKWIRIGRGVMGQ